MICPGCGRDELHKLCPAYGTPYYMSGTVFTKDMEMQWLEKIAAEKSEKAKPITPEIQQ
jgi:hypothetical protein